MLKDVITKVGCVSGCRMTISYVSLRKGRVYQNSGASTFEEGNIGPSNVVTDFIKRVKTKGAMKGK